MLDDDNVEAGSKEPKGAKLTVQASLPNNTLPLPPISILQSHDSEQEHDELEPSEEHLSDNMDDEGDRPDDPTFEQSEEEGEDVEEHSHRKKWADKGTSVPEGKGKQQSSHTVESFGNAVCTFFFARLFH